MTLSYLAWSDTSHTLYQPRTQHLDWCGVSTPTLKCAINTSLIRGRIYLLSVKQHPWLWSVWVISGLAARLDENCARLAASSGNSRYSVTIRCTLMQHGYPCTECVSESGQEYECAECAFLLFLVSEKYIVADTVYNSQYLSVGLSRITPKCRTCPQKLHLKMC